MEQNKQAVYNVLSQFVLENAELKIAIEEYLQLIKTKEAEIVDLKKQLEEATGEDDLQ